ncbi:hypothetical protein M2347_003929 [Chryseobacterium sp. H1D6B]|nr:hypothetical protein [Chryseobacterium sp. H1D6B]
MTNILQKGHLILCFGKISKIQAVFNDTVILDPHGCKRLSDCITVNVQDLSPAKIEFQTLITLGFEIKHQSNDCYVLTYNEELLLIYDKKINRAIMCNTKNTWTISTYIHDLQDDFYNLTGDNLNYRIQKCSCCK